MTIDNINDIELLPAARPIDTKAVDQLRQHAEMMRDAKLLADAMCATDMVPADYKGKAGNGAAAILYGAELGLNPIQSLQQIFIVHGRPAIYARTAVALIKRHGILVETVSSEDTAVTVRATDTRTGQVEETTWSIERAKQAGYTKNAKYQSNPQEMLWAKAAMEVARRVAPDVLLGIPYSVEDLTVGEPVRVKAERVDMGQRTLDALNAKLGKERPADDQAPPADPPIETRMASKSQLAKLAQIRAADGHDDASWFGWLTDVLGVAVASESDITEAHALQVLGMFQEGE